MIAGGTAPFTWTATGLPPGLSLRTDATSSTVFPPGGAEVWGTPTVAGAYNNPTVRKAVVKLLGSALAGSSISDVSADAARAARAARDAA